MATIGKRRLAAKQAKLRRLGLRRSRVVTGAPLDVVVVDSSKGSLDVPLAAVQRAAEEQRSINALGSAMAANDAPATPEIARSLQAEENWWRKIEAEHGWLNSTDTAVLLGRSPNRTFASTQRSGGKLLGYRRGKSDRYPKFQFDLAKGQVHQVIPELIEVSRSYKVPDEDLVLWLCSPTSAFAEQDRPVDHLDDQERLLAAAHDEFGVQW